MNLKTWFRVGAASLLLFPVAAQADVTGTIDATITLEAGCIINGQNYDDGSANVDFGTLDFGTHNTLFVEADAQVQSGGGALMIQCSNGIAPILSFNAGQNDGSGTGGGVRAMAHTTDAGRFVTYNLYEDAARTTLIPIGEDVTLLDTGEVQTVNIYASAFGESGLTPGVYTDVVTVVLEL